MTVSELVAEEDERRRRARDELRRQQRMYLVENSNWRRINWDDLLFASHTIEDTSTGEEFKRYRGEVLDAVNLPITAWAITPDGPLFLEPV